MRSWTSINDCTIWSTSVRCTSPLDLLAIQDVDTSCSSFPAGSATETVLSPSGQHSVALSPAPVMFGGSLPFVLTAARLALSEKPPASPVCSEEGSKKGGSVKCKSIM